MKSYHILVVLLVAFVIFPHLTAAADLEIEKDLQNGLKHARSMLGKAQETLERGLQRTEKTDGPKAAELRELLTHAEDIRIAHLILQERFKIREEQIKNLGAKAAERHQVMVEGYLQVLEKYVALIDLLESLPAEEEVPEPLVRELSVLLDTLLYKKKPLIFGSLPYRTLKYPAKIPVETPSIQPAYEGGNTTVAPDDLKSTPEAPITEEIATLAESLEWNPALIYEWVKNNIATEWYWGSMKGAVETLRQKSGNDCDQADLLVALLRASGYPTRYVRGVIEFLPDIELVKNLTGIDDPLRIAVFFQKAGIPYQPVLAGGTITNFQIEHIWVESQVPFANFHGAVMDEHGKVWVALDTSIKAAGYTYNDSLDISQDFSLSTISDQYLSTVRDQTLLEYLQTEIETNAASYEDYLRTQTLNPEVLHILPASLQYKQIHVSHEYTEVPQELIHQVRFAARDTNNNELFDITLNTLKLSNQKLSVTYEPETVEDHEIINSYGGLGNTPAYLVRLRPTLQLNGENIVVSREGLPIGAEYELTVELISPNGVEQTTNTHITGNYAVIGIVAQQAVTPEPVPDEEKDAWRLLYEEALSYIKRWNQAEEELAGLLQLSLTRPVPTVVTLGGVLDVTYLLDTPHGVEWKGLYVDTDFKAIEVVTGNQLQDGDNVPKEFMRLSSLQGSILEHQIFEDDFQVKSISTAKLFQLANESQIPILVLDNTNIENLLPTLPFAEGIKEDLRNAVNQGLTVEIPESELTYEDWTGIGYIKEEPETGAAGWMLSGNIAGGMTAGPWPETLLERFANAYSAPPNTDPDSAYYMYKIPETDMQEGRVGETLAKRLQVIVLDKEGRPVKGAEVTFTVKAGGGTLSGNMPVLTDVRGVASVSFKLGQKTSANPTYLKKYEFDQYWQQVGENLVEASLASGLSLPQPFIAYGFPTLPTKIIKIYGDHNDSERMNILSFAGFVSVRVEDQYENPVANIPITFAVQPPENLSTCSNPNQDTRPAQLIQSDDLCLKTKVSPTLGECSSERNTLELRTDAEGKTFANILLGGIPDAKYPISATYSNLSQTFLFYTLPFGDCDSQNADPSDEFRITSAYPTDAYGNNIYGMPTGKNISLYARAYYLRENEKNGTECNETCTKIVGSREYYIDTDFTSSEVKISGLPCVPQQAGTYLCTHKITSGVNSITFDAKAAVNRQYYNNNCAKDPPECRNVLSNRVVELATSTTMTLYGVDAQVGAGTNGDLLVDKDGFSLKDYTITSSISPAEYQAHTAFVQILKDGESVHAIETEKTGTGAITLSKGYHFDLQGTYTARVILNVGKKFQGESLEIKSNAITLPIRPFVTELEAEASPVTTTIDRINQLICPSPGTLNVTLFDNANLTITVDGSVLESTAGVPVQDIPFPAGSHRFYITSDMVPLPGEHEFTVTAEFTEEDISVTKTVTGTFYHDVIINGSLPIGHTIIKGVDIWDGHLTHSTQDIMIPGRGLSLDFTRSYSSAGDSGSGPLGAGWTHSYNIRLIQDSCGRFVVVGGEGTGNAFSSAYKDPDKAALFGLSPNVDFFKPQIGYHSTLVRDPAHLDQGFDFYTKAHTRYHFEIEPALSTWAQNIYTLRFIEEPNGNRMTLTYDEAPPLGDYDPATLDSVTDSSGRMLTFEYEIPDIYGQKRIRFVRGLPSTLDLEIEYRYDELGNLREVIRKGSTGDFNDERVESYTYTEGGPVVGHNMLSYTDPNGNTTHYEYYEAPDDIQGYVSSFGILSHELIKAIHQPEGVTTEFITYDFNNNIRIVTDPRPDVGPTTYTLNNYGATVLIEAPRGKRTRMEWCLEVPNSACPNREGQPGIDALMVMKQDAEDRTHNYKYDYLGNLVEETIQFTGSKAPVTLKDGTTTVSQVTTNYTYDPLFSKMISKTDAEGNSTFYCLDSPSPSPDSRCPAGGGRTGNLLASIDAEGNISRNTYYANGDLQTVTDPRNFITRYTSYDDYGNPETVEQPEGKITTNVFDIRSRLKDSSDTFGHHVTYDYDSLDRKIREERLEDSGETGTPQVVTYRYKFNGELKEKTDGLGQTTEYIYDQLNRQRFIIEHDIPDPLTGNDFIQMEYRYDEDSNVVAEIDCRSVSKIHTYDELNRRTKTEMSGDFGGPVNPDKVLTEYTYDLVGDKLSETDLHGHTTGYVYDGLYRVVETRLPFSHGFSDVPFQSAVVKTAYDRAGNKVRETDANGNPTTYVYDNIYRLREETDADGNTLSYDYDAASNKIREENQSSGLVTEWTNPDYDGLNRPQVMRQTVPLGGPGLTDAVYETFYDYEDTDNAFVVTNPRGFKTRTDKDGLDRVFQEVVDPGGLNLTTTFTYDANGNVRTIKDPQGGDIDVTHTYDGLNRKFLSEYVSTPSDNGQTVTEEFVYDGNGNLIEYTDKRSIIFTNEYDNLNRVLTKKVKESITNNSAELTLTAFSYDDANNTVSETDANGNVTTTRFDELHRPSEIDDPDPAGLIVYSYDGVNKRAQIDKKGQRTEYDYDVINRLTDTREFDLTGGLKTTQHTEYKDDENIVEETDRRGITTIRQLDALERLVQLKRSGLDMALYYNTDEVLLETYEYDGNNNKTIFRDAEGNETQYSYDGADRMEGLTEGFGSAVAATTTYTYDNIGNTLTVKDGRNHGSAFDIQYTYDARYRKETATNGEGETITYAYDPNDNLIRTVEPKGGAAFTTLFRYDELNELLAVDESSRADANTTAGVTRFFYDANRNKIAQQEANNNLVTYKYDKFNRLIDTYQHTVAGTLSDNTVRGSDPRGIGIIEGGAAGGEIATSLHWHYGYDLNSNQTLILDAKGQRVDITYDYLDRVETKSYSNHANPGLDFQMQSLSYTYDGNSNIKSISEVKKLAGANITETTIGIYDPLDRLQIRRHYDHDDLAGKRIEYEYDLQGNRKVVKDPDNFITTYTYDARNRLETVTTEAGKTIYEWWEDDLLKKVTYANGTVHDCSDPNAYDAADRIKLITNGPGFSSYEYGYDDNGNRWIQVETQSELPAGNPNIPETTTYAYDNLNRLRSLTYGTGATMDYTYEPNGNRLTEVGVDPHTGQPVDRTYKYEELPGKTGVTFNHVNALTRIVDNLDPNKTVNYEYDRNLNQTEKEKGGISTQYHFGIRDQILWVTTAQDVTIAKFDYDYNRMRVKKLSADTGKETRYFYDQDAVLLEYNPGTTFPTTIKYNYGYELHSLTEIDPAGSTNAGDRENQFYLKDGLMSTANLTDESGALKHSYRYDAWGRIRDEAGTSKNPREYIGHYKDDETGLHYFGARYYDDETGRFLSQDPYLGEANTPPSLHRYLYAYANPLRFVDLTGYQSQEINGSRCIGDICQRRDGTWVNRGAEVTQAEVRDPKTEKSDDYVVAENKKDLTRMKAPMLKDAEEMERKLEKAIRLYKELCESEMARGKAKSMLADVKKLEALHRYGGTGDKLMYLIENISKMVASAGEDPGTAQVFSAALIHGIGSYVAGALNLGAATGTLSGKTQTDQEISFWDILGAGGDVMQVFGNVGGAISNIRRASRIRAAREIIQETLSGESAVSHLSAQIDKGGIKPGASIGEVIKRTKLEELMFELSEEMGVEIASAKIEGLPFRRFVLGEAKKVSTTELLTPIPKTAGTITTTLPNGKKVIKVVREHSSHDIKVVRKDVIELTHTHSDQAGGAVFSWNKGNKGDIPSMKAWAKDAPFTVFGVIGSTAIRLALAAEATLLKK